jgi:ATP-dependent DNA ligase
MEARLVAELPDNPGWQFEPKWGGFRCLAYRAGTQIDLRVKSGKSLARYFREVAAMLKQLPQKEFVVDGELAVPVGDTLSFDALQLRVHPAESRVKKLAAETPALLILFDVLVDPQGRNLIELPLSKRRAALAGFYKSARETERLKLSRYTLDLDEARRWLDDTSGAIEGRREAHRRRLSARSPANAQG